jgi:hypothetical protein
MTEPEKRDLQQTIDDAVTFPILTRELDDTYAPGGYDGGAQLVGGSLNRVAQQTIRRVLGWRHRDGDAKGFTAALGKAFTLKDVEGHTEWEWKPQAFTLEADLGEITGAQASIHNQASLILEQAIKLLNGLESLKPTADEEDVDAIRSIIRGELQALIEELGLKCGPRVERVDLIFAQLLTDEKGATTDALHIHGQLELLRNRYGLKEEQVNTIEEELNLTNFIILVDHVLAVYQTWKAKRNLFKRHGSTFFGTQLVRLSQELEVIVEEVHEAYTIMDSVLFGEAEREARLLTITDETKMTIAELLGWVESFASSEGPELLRASGKDGARPFARTSETLHTLVDALAKRTDLPSGLNTPRVKRTLGGIAEHLAEVARLAKDVARKGEPSGYLHGPEDSDIKEREARVDPFKDRKFEPAVLEWNEPIEVTRDKAGTIAFQYPRPYVDIEQAALVRDQKACAQLKSSVKDAKGTKGGKALHRLEFDVTSIANGPCDLAYRADGHDYYIRKAVLIKG